MRLLFAMLMAGTVLGCVEEDLFGPPPLARQHLLAFVDGRSFDVSIPAGRCSGVSSPAGLAISVPETAQSHAPTISITLDGVTVEGTYSITSGDAAIPRVTARYTPGDPAVQQYTAILGRGAVWVEAIDVTSGIAAGRFWFDAAPTTGTAGPARVAVRQGSSRVRLETHPPQGC